MKNYISKSVFIWVTALTGLTGCESEIPTSEPITIGHRGLPILFPENTKESFDGLIANGIFSVETDILMAAGDSVMIFHDPEISRLTNMTGPLTEKTPTEIKKGISVKLGGTGRSKTNTPICHLASDRFFEREKNKWRFAVLA